ncbi:ABATE domain-containing protein [Actinomadura sp. WMMB 499]|uniref:CGNR zinc finger domain-containing protein n=1 Tax=Actinomadura sp. WMMB 499 TaxID=1219491 RepID=UPI0012480DB5|nr:CGNR zinc finger domain-containing protein [Actinomadura sp. WMMB 499]QFG23611.1 CGNR zinc finger domain-containing protein [Actinomadura sp. WMMB 499]
MSTVVPLTGEPLALDLVNTRTAAGDLLATPDDLHAWVKLQAGRLPDGTCGDLEAVRAVRAHTAAALERVRHGERPDAADLAALNDAQRAAAAISEVTWDGSAVAVARRRAGAEALAAALAEAAAELLADPAVTKVRQCEADGCVLLFLPAHPRRRWCSAARCGNRARVARHYRKHRGID